MADDIPEFLDKDLNKIPERILEELNLTGTLEGVSKLEKSERSPDSLLNTHANLISQTEVFEIDAKFPMLENEI